MQSAARRLAEAVPHSVEQFRKMNGARWLGNVRHTEFVCLDTFEGGTNSVTDQPDTKTPASQTPPPPATHPKGPDRELELKLKKNPEEIGRAHV